MRDILMQFKGTIICGIIALIVAILFISIGFWKTVLLVLILGAGLFIGFSIDRRGSVRDYVDDMWNKKD